MSPPHAKVFAVFILVAAQCHATSIVVVVSGHNVVIAADSKQGWANPSLHDGEKVEPSDKLVVLNDKVVVGIAGLTRSDIGWDANLFLDGIKNSLSVDAHLSLAETVIVDKLKPYMDRFSSYMMNDPIHNKKAFPTMLFELILVGYENGIPVVDTIEVDCDWNSGKASGPIANSIDPSENCPAGSSFCLCPFGEGETFHTAFVNPDSVERVAATKLAGLSGLFVKYPDKPMDSAAMTAIATSVVRLEMEFRPEAVGPPIHLIVWNGVNKPAIKTLPE